MTEIGDKPAYLLLEDLERHGEMGRANPWL
jgi:hypothetical protein